MTAEIFFKKNIKYIVFILFFLFIIKSFQSCNRNMTIKKLNKEIVNLNDSLSTTYGIEKETLVLQLRECEKEVQKLQYDVKLAESEKNAANRRADAVQTTASKIRENTTIKIENNSIKDTIKVNKN